MSNLNVQYVPKPKQKDFSMPEYNPDCPICIEEWKHPLWALQQFHVHSQYYADYCVGRYIRCHRGRVRCPAGRIYG